MVATTASVVLRLHRKALLTLFSQSPQLMQNLLELLCQRVRQSNQGILDSEQHANIDTLTGCFNRSVRDIQPLGGKPVLRLYARVGTLQDSKASPADFIAEAARMRCNAALCCLAPSANPDHPDRLPDAQAYLAAFKAAGWRICSIEKRQW